MESNGQRGGKHKGGRRYEGCRRKRGDSVMLEVTSFNWINADTLPRRDLNRQMCWITVMQLKLFCIEYFDFVHLSSIAFKIHLTFQS